MIRFRNIIVALQLFAISDYSLGSTTGGLSVVRVSDAAYSIAHTVDDGLVLYGIIGGANSLIGFWDGFGLTWTPTAGSNPISNVYKIGSTVLYSADVDDASFPNGRWYRWTIGTPPTVAQDLPVGGFGVEKAFRYDYLYYATSTWDPSLLHATTSIYRFDGTTVAPLSWSAEVHPALDSEHGIVGGNVLLEGDDNTLLTFDGRQVRSIANNVPLEFLESLSSQNFIDGKLYSTARIPWLNEVGVYRTDGSTFETVNVPWPAKPVNARYFENRIYAVTVDGVGHYEVASFNGNAVESVPFASDNIIVDVHGLDTLPNGALALTARLGDTAEQYVRLVLGPNGFQRDNLPPEPGTWTIVPGVGTYFVRIERVDGSFDAFETSDFIDYRALDVGHFVEITWLPDSLSPAVETSQGAFVGARPSDDDTADLNLMWTIDGKTLTPVLYTDPTGRETIQLEGGLDTFPSRFVDNANAVYVWDHQHGLFMIQREDSVARVDYNHNGVVDAGDFDIQANAMRAGDYRESMDLEWNGALDIGDRRRLAHDFAHWVFGDSDLDGEFSTADLVQIFQSGQYEDDVVGNSTWTTGDWSGDQEFSTEDVVIAFQDGGYERPMAAELNVVPEPTSVSLVCLSVCAAPVVNIVRRCSKHRPPTESD